MIKTRVEHVLKTIEKTRNSDRSLIAWVWYTFNPDYFKVTEGKYFFNMDHIMDVPSSESIRRCRQKFQEEGLYLPTDPSVVKERKKKELAINQTIQTPHWSDGIDDLG